MRLVAAIIALVLLAPLYPNQVSGSALVITPGVWFDDELMVKGTLSSFDPFAKTFKSPSGATYTYQHLGPEYSYELDGTTIVVRETYFKKDDGRYYWGKDISYAIHGELIIHKWDTQPVHVVYPRDRQSPVWEEIAKETLDSRSSHLTKLDLDLTARVPVLHPPLVAPVGAKIVEFTQAAQSYVDAAAASYYSEAVVVSEPGNSTPASTLPVFLGTLISKGTRNDDERMDPKGAQLHTALLGGERFAGRPQSGDEVQIGSGFTKYIDTDFWSPHLVPMNGGFLKLEAEFPHNGCCSSPLFAYEGDFRPTHQQKFDGWSVQVSYGASFFGFSASIGTELNDPDGASVGMGSRSWGATIDFSPGFEPDSKEKALGFRAGIGALDGVPGAYSHGTRATMSYAITKETKSRVPYYLTDEISSSRQFMWTTYQVGNWNPGSQQKYPDHAAWDMKTDFAFKRADPATTLANCGVISENERWDLHIDRDPCADWTVTLGAVYDVAAFSPFSLTSNIWFWDTTIGNWVHLAHQKCGVGPTPTGDGEEKFGGCVYRVPREGASCPLDWEYACLSAEGEYVQILDVNGGYARADTFVVNRDV